MPSKKEKELWSRMCECGHTYGEHSCVMPRKCLRVMTCCGDNRCKGFRLKQDRDRIVGSVPGVKTQPMPIEPYKKVKMMLKGDALHKTKDDNNVKEVSE